jgi:hypothetical protein
VRWGNPHAELEIDLPARLEKPADLARRTLPAQSAQIDGPALLAQAAVPRRADRRWTVELAPLTRMEAWKVPKIEPGDTVSVVGFHLPRRAGRARGAGRVPVRRRPRVRPEVVAGRLRPQRYLTEQP